MNGLVAGSALDSLQSAGAVPKSLRGTVTYVAGTTGSVAPHTIFTVTGDVRLTNLAAKCTTDLTSAGAPTFDLGVTGNTTCFAATAPDVTGWDAGEWYDVFNNSYAAGRGFDLIDNGQATPAGLVTISADIIQTIATATITGGVVRWYVSYIPLSADGAITLPATTIAF